MARDAYSLWCMDCAHGHPQDVFIKSDGSTEYQETWVVSYNESLATVHTGGVCVHEGATFELSSGGQLSGSLTLQAGSSARISGRHAGSLTLQAGCHARIDGQHAGSLHVGPDSVVDVVGSQSGSVHVARTGLVRVHPGGKLAGSLKVAGLVENRGIRGGEVRSSGGVIHDLEGGSVEQPIRREGVNYYSL